MRVNLARTERLFRSESTSDTIFASAVRSELVLRYILLGRMSKLHRRIVLSYAEERGIVVQHSRLTVVPSLFLA